MTRSASPAVEDPSAKAVVVRPNGESSVASAMSLDTIANIPLPTSSELGRLETESEEDSEDYEHDYDSNDSDSETE